MSREIYTYTDLRTLGNAPFWNEIKNSYPNLFNVLHRIKIYRHSEDHLMLKQDVAKQYSEYWSTDTQGISNPDEQRFVIQQKLLEEFLTAIQIEIDAIT